MRYGYAKKEAIEYTMVEVIITNANALTKYFIQKRPYSKLYTLHGNNGIFVTQCNNSEMQKID